MEDRLSPTVTKEKVENREKEEKEREKEKADKEPDKEKETKPKSKEKDDKEDIHPQTTNTTAAQKAQADYTGTSLKFFHALGFKKIPSKCIEHVNDESLVYLVGKHVAIFNYENKVHRFILKNSKTAQIVAFCVSSNRRYIALSERLMEENGIQVSVYNFNTASRVRTLSFAYFSKQPVVALDFSRDNKYLVTVTKGPEANIFLWQLDKARLLGMQETTPVTKVSMSPWAHWKMCTTSPTSLKIWQFQENSLKPLDPTISKRRDYKYTCHAWFDDDNLVVGTEDGDILILVGENERAIELKATLHNVNEGHAIWAICAIGRGFVCGGDSGYFTLFERTYDQDHFRLYKMFRTQERQRIVDISISPNEESVVCCFENNEMVHFSLANVDLNPENDPTNFRPLPIGFHWDTVTAVDVCQQKSIVVTASIDKQVRVWNFLKKKLEVVKQFDEEALSIGCHPTGLRLVIGFKYRMCMFNLLVNDLHLCSDFPVKNCREVRFSHGGQYFASVIVNRILLFNTYTFECLGSLQGHSSMVKSICWTKNDTGLVSAGFEGAVYTWKVEEQKREDSEDSTLKSTAYSCLRYDPATSMIAAIGSNKVAESGAAEGEVTLRQILKGTELKSTKPGCISQKHSSKAHTAELAICTLSQTIFLGTPTGQLLLYKWPLTDNAQPYFKYDIHQGEILFVVLSTDEKYLFTIGDDGSLFMFDVDMIVEGRPLSKKSFNYAIFDDVSYMLQGDLDEKVRNIGVLESKLDDVNRDRKAEVDVIRSGYEEDKHKKDSDHQKTVAEMKAQVEEAVKERDKAKQAVLDNEKQLEALHMKAAEELESLYQKRTEEQNSKYQVLKEEKDDLIVRYENKIYKTSKQHEEDSTSMIASQHEAVQDLQTKIEELQARKERLVKENEDMFQEMCQDYEMEIDGVKDQFNVKLKRETEDLLTAKSQTAVFKKKFDGLNTKIKELKLEKEELMKALAKKDKKIEDSERSIAGLKLEITVRNDTISTSEKKILELKKQTAELEKLRYVLTFKFNELRKEVAPKEEQIKIMNERIQEMDEELERVGIDRDTLKQTLVSKDEKITVLLKNLKKTSQLLDDKERLISLLLRELTELVAANDPKHMVYQLKDIIMQYNSKYQQEDVTNERDKTQEFERQRDYMEAQLASMKKQAVRKEMHLRHDNTRKTSENALLVKEINDLRHEKKILATRLGLTEMNLKEAKAQLQQQQQQRQQPASTAAATLPSKATHPSAEEQWATRTGGGLGVRTPPGGIRPSGRGGAAKGKLVKGSTARNLRDLSQMDPNKVAEIVATVERNNAEMARQQEEIKRLREFVQHLLSRAEEERQNSQKGEGGQEPTTTDFDVQASAAAAAVSLPPSMVASPEPDGGGHMHETTIPSVTPALTSSSVAPTPGPPQSTTPGLSTTPAPGSGHRPDSATLPTGALSEPVSPRSQSPEVSKRASSATGSHPQQPIKEKKSSLPNIK